MIRSLRHLVPFWHRTFVVLCVGLVLALGVFGANADLHHLLHADDHAGDHAPSGADDGCAVVLWNGGATAPLEIPRQLFAPHVFVEVVAGPVFVVTPAAPDFRLPPGRGPPSV
ncbi:MAG: hypothetical protein Q8J74_06390 [Candidatus Didemnitutus sp.]|nr:hypothetical protein [Candidatus Didemnitutus sp.]